MPSGCAPPGTESNGCGRTALHPYIGAVLVWPRGRKLQSLDGTGIAGLLSNFVRRSRRLHVPSRRVTGAIDSDALRYILTTLQPLGGQTLFPGHGEHRVPEQYAPRPPRHAQVADPLTRVVRVVVMRTGEGTHTAAASLPNRPPHARVAQLRRAAILLTCRSRMNICGGPAKSRSPATRSPGPAPGRGVTERSWSGEVESGLSASRGRRSWWWS